MSMYILMSSIETNDTISDILLGGWGDTYKRSRVTTQYMALRNRDSATGLLLLSGVHFVEIR
jgi:hypothetical protein